MLTVVGGCAASHIVVALKRRVKISSCVTTTGLATVLFATAVGNADVAVVVIGGAKTVGAGVVGAAADALGLITTLGWVCGMFNLFCHNKLAV